MIEDNQFCYLLMISDVLFYTHWGMIMFGNRFYFTVGGGLPEVFP